jgi:hypothetical protein
MSAYFLRGGRFRFNICQSKKDGFVRLATTSPHLNKFKKAGGQNLTVSKIIVKQKKRR